jgi:RNA polymerase sigma-70 factor (ECF subfamily)
MVTLSDLSVKEATNAPSVAEAQMRMLYDLHAGPLYRFLLRVTFGERQAVEDLLQETFLRAWRNLGEMRTGVENLRPWLFTVARRVAIDAGRARQARPVAAFGVDLARVPGDDDSIERLVVTQSLVRAMTRLSPDHRDVIFEIYFNESTTTEAAARLGIPEGTVKSRTHYALRALRKALDKASEGL